MQTTIWLSFFLWQPLVLIETRLRLWDGKHIQRAHNLLSAKWPMDKPSSDARPITARGEFRKCKGDGFKRNQFLFKLCTTGLIQLPFPAKCVSWKMPEIRSKFVEGRMHQRTHVHQRKTKRRSKVQGIPEKRRHWWRSENKELSLQTQSCHHSSYYPQAHTFSPSTVRHREYVYRRNYLLGRSLGCVLHAAHRPSALVLWGGGDWISEARRTLTNQRQSGAPWALINSVRFLRQQVETRALPSRNFLILIRTRIVTQQGATPECDQNPIAQKRKDQRTKKTDTLPKQNEKREVYQPSNFSPW